VTTLRSFRLFLWTAIAALVLALGVFLLWRGGPVGTIASAAIGGPFSLTDQHGGTVTEASLRGHPSAMFFGYTYCPDVCPTTLYDLTQWLQELGPAGDRLKVYFVTVDPERDTQAQLASYLSAFDPRIEGLTGSRPAIDQVLRAYRVYSRKVPQKDGSYLMDHAAAVYLLNGDGQLTGTLDYQEEPAVALDKLKRLVASG
jgi:protein SCO1